jgi:hypothetical protein
MKTAVMEKTVGAFLGLSADGDVEKNRMVLSPSDSEQEEPILKPAAMRLLRVERRHVGADEVFRNRISLESLQTYRRLKGSRDQGEPLPPSIESINAMTVADNYIPEELSHQDLRGTAIRRQAEFIGRAPFIKAVASHPEYRDLPGFEIPKTLMRETMEVLNALRGIGNFFRRRKIQTMNGSPAEVQIAARCFGSLWPAGIDLYGILRELYPAFHARVTGQVPFCLANAMEKILEAPVRADRVLGVGRFSIDRRGRFLGLYPVCAVPVDHVTGNSTFVSQDQLGRKAVAGRVLEDILQCFKTSPSRRVLVIDYAGGVGNLSELLLSRIFDLRDTALRNLLLDRVRVVVIDIAEDQLAAGVGRFQKKEKQTRYRGLLNRILFLKGDVTRPLTDEHRNALEEKFGEGFLGGALSLGMTSYTIGALDNIRRQDGTTAAQAMAEEMFRQCRKIYAVDFSSPMWRLEAFMKDAGPWGREYLRVVHGVADPDDEMEPLNRLLSLYLKIRFGLKMATVADFVRFMSISGALASHYSTVWPGVDGHNAGYGVLEDGSLKKPGVLSFAETLQNRGAELHYQSKVWLFGTLDLGKTGQDHRAWALIPGWVADFVVAEKHHST